MRTAFFVFIGVSCIAMYIGIESGYDIPLWCMALPFVITFLVLGWGALNINSQFFVKTECSFPAEGRQVMLTFDDGPDPEKTPQILALLKKYDAKGVFFCIGHKVDAHPETARLVVESGHQVGSHSYEHGYLFDLKSAPDVETDLTRAHYAIGEATGIEPVLFRPPYGVTNPNIAKALKMFDYRVIGWNLRSFDTLIHEPQKLEKRVLKRIRPGSIILLHDTAPAVLPVLESILRHLHENGYTTRLA